MIHRTNNVYVLETTFNSSNFKYEIYVSSTYFYQANSFDIFGIKVNDSPSVESRCNLSNHFQTKRGLNRFPFFL